MKQSLIILFALFCGINLSGQIDSTDPSITTDFQEMRLSSDEGLSIADGTEITKTYSIVKDRYGWTAEQMPDVLSFLGNKTQYLNLSISNDQRFIEVNLIIIDDDNDHWGITEWNNHLNTIK